MTAWSGVDEPVAPPVGGDGLVAVRVRLDLGYDGTDFAGWAEQRGRRTVEGTVAGALGTVLRLPAPPRLTVAGRTDAGVHARGQVAHLDVAAAVWAGLPGRSPRTGEQSLLRRLNGVLPPDIRVHRVRLAPPGFDARFSALSRRYAYRIADDPQLLDPLRRHEVLAWPRPLDVPAMAAAAAGLLGEHDFAAYCRHRPGASSVRRLLELDPRRGPSEGGGPGLLVIGVRADAFCHNMVRALVGALLAVGEDRRPVGWPAQVLAGGRRDPAVQVVPPHGLTLEGVDYPGAEGLAEQAERTRRRREPTSPPQGRAAAHPPGPPQVPGSVPAAAEPRR